MQPCGYDMLASDHYTNAFFVWPSCKCNTIRPLWFLINYFVSCVIALLEFSFLMDYFLWLCTFTHWVFNYFILFYFIFCNIKDYVGRWGKRGKGTGPAQKIDTTRGGKGYDVQESKLLSYGIHTFGSVNYLASSEVHCKSIKYVYG